MYHFLTSIIPKETITLIVDSPNFLFYSTDDDYDSPKLADPLAPPSILPPNRWFAAPAFHAPSPTGSRIFGTPCSKRPGAQFQARGRAPWLGKQEKTPLGCWLSRALISVCPPEKVATIWPEMGGCLNGKRIGGSP